jgi:hypothetical protein
MSCGNRGNWGNREECGDREYHGDREYCGRREQQRQPSARSPLPTALSPQPYNPTLLTRKSTLSLIHFQSSA